jgi:hypothetical protein
VWTNVNLLAKQIKILRFNNEGEYTSKELVAFYTAARITRELIVPHNPQ